MLGSPISSRDILGDIVSISSRQSSSFHDVTRSTVFSLAVLITAVILLLRSFSATLNGYSSYYRDAFGHGRSLRTWLTEEKARYVVAVQERLELIKKVGAKGRCRRPVSTDYA
jgi:hypothetical protein